ncbi:MAG: glycosyltransferase [Microlunatus sp.]|nr:glycosyltransferase [Microlunatus sp.]
MDESMGPGAHSGQWADAGDTNSLPRIDAPLWQRPSSHPSSQQTPVTPGEYHDYQREDYQTGRQSAYQQLDDEDLWAWAGIEEPPAVIDISHCRVTAVLVTQNAARWLPETLTALAGLTRRPDRVIAIDNESSDETLDLLDDAIQRRELDAVYLGKHGYGYGDAIRSALAQDAALHPRGAAEPGADDWLWLLHDDAAPAPEALAQLLGHVVTDPSIDITGPKLLHPRRRHRPHQISEIGVSIAKSGRRHIDIDAGEIDQGQRDQPARRLAVSSCAMLVRRTVWDELRGFDPAMPGFRDGLEFGWRAQLAGYKVLTTPAAVVVHRQVGRAGLRPSGFGGVLPEKVDREFGMAVVAAHAPAGLLPLVWIRLVLGSLLRATAYLVGKVPGRSGSELGAACSFVRHPRRILRMRRRIKAGRITARGESVVSLLRPARFSGIKAALDSVTTVIGDRYVEIAGTVESTSLDELTSDLMPTAPDDRRTNPWFSPIIITLVLSLIACLVAARRVIGLGSLAAPQLLPISDSISRLWHSFSAAIPGAPHATNAPWTGLVAAVSTLFFGQPEWLVTVLIIGTVPLALLSIYPLLRKIIDDRRVRLWVAVSYALLPVLLGGSNQGRLVLTVAAIILPVLVISARALVLRRPGNPESWRGGWGVGLALTVLGAFVPSLIGVALVLAVFAAFTVVRSPRKIGRLFIAIGTPLVILSPWWPTFLTSWSTSWGRLLTGPDPALEGTPAPATAWMYLVGRDGGAGLPPLWIGMIIFGSFWAAAFVGLLRGYRRRGVLTGWLVGLMALAIAVGLSRFLVVVPPAGTQARPYVGVYLLIAFGALVLAGGIGIDGYTRDLGRKSFSPAQPLSVLAGGLAVVISLTAAGWWVLDGMAGPIHRTPMTAIPPYVVDAQTGPDQVRTLAISLNGRDVSYSVVEGDQTRLGDAERGYAFGGSTAARQQVSGVVSRLVSGSGDTDLAADLADLGVNYVWVGGANSDVRSRITNTPGLSPASGSATGAVWQLTQPTSRVRLVSGQQVTRLPSGQNTIQVPRSSLQRVLRLGVPVDPRWHATLDGKPLTPLQDGNWQQSFTVPVSGGELTYELSSPIPWLPLGQGALLLITLVLAAPGVRRPEVRDPMQVARRAATADDDSYTRLDLGMTSTTDFSEISGTTGLITVSDGVTTSTGGTGGDSLLGTTTLHGLQEAEDPVQVSGFWRDDR